MGAQTPGLFIDLAGDMDRETRGNNLDKEVRRLWV
jgi:hypothetical protein